MINESIAYMYAKWAAEEELYIGKWVRLQCQEWIDIADGKSEEAYVCEKTYEKMCKLLKLLVHPDLQCSIYEGLEPYAWLLITAIFCTKKREDDTRYYVTGLLEIGRKNFKTFNCGVIFILLMLMEPQFSRFFSVAPDLLLSSELKQAIRKIIKSSPKISKYFKVLRSQIRCELTESEYTPLAYSKDGMDGKLANAFLADEAGALDDYPVEAMRSSQITLHNKLGIIISTQYPNDNNVMITEIDMAKRMLADTDSTHKTFALLYEPDEELQIGDIWQTDDRVLYQANPVAVTYDYIMDDLREKRAVAVIYPNKRENFLCKHCNIKFKSLGSEAYIEITDVKKCVRVEDSEWWKGRRVWLGADLSMTEDNTSVAMVTIENSKIYAKVWGFIPEDRKAEKSKREGVDYDKLIRKGVCFASEGATINYSDVENFILDIPDKYGVEIVMAAFDKYNALSTIQKLEEKGIECVIVRQHSDTLHMPTKLLKEAILNEEFAYDENELLEINFENARCVYDNNMNRYVNKKKSSGKVDMVVSLINAIYLAQQEILYGSEFIVDVI